MKKGKFVSIALSTALLSVTLLLLCAAVAAQNTRVKGVINGRIGATMSLQTDSGDVPLAWPPF